MHSRFSMRVGLIVKIVVVTLATGCAPVEVVTSAPPPEPAILLFSVNDAYYPSGQGFNGHAVRAAAGDTTVAGPQYVYRLAVVHANSVDIDGRHNLTMDDYWSINSDGFMFFIGGDPASGVPEFQTFVMTSGEGTAEYQYVSMADALTYEIIPCDAYCIPTLHRLSQDYYVFGRFEYPVPGSGAELTYEGRWLSAFLREIDGQIAPTAIEASGSAVFSVLPDSGTMTGRLTPLRVVSGNTGSTVDLDLSDIVLVGTAAGNGIEGTAEASLDFYSPDDRLVGTFSASLYGPDRSEIGGVMTLYEDYSHIGGVDPQPLADISLIGAFIGR